MYIIIDACNVLFQDSSEKTISAKRRVQFLDELVQYTCIKNHELVVVFDGGLHARARVSRHQALEVWDAGFESTADDCICLLLDRVKNGYEALLVSSDNELNKYAEDLDIVSIESALFKKIVQQSVQRLKKNTLVAKQKTDYIAFGPDCPELDALMMSRADSIFDKDARNKRRSENKNVAIASDGVRMSKLERRLVRILEKL